jgi:divalent metal cation (Fe/Co/Zn/Cd) transporter
MMIEVLASVAAGLMAGSLALLAFGGDSIIELISGFVVLKQLRSGSLGFAGDEAERAERVTAALLFSLIPIIALSAAYSLLSGSRPQGSPLGIAVALGAVVVMPYLYYQKKKIGEETSTMILKMDAIESVTCFFMSVALLIGLLIEYFFGLWWVDFLATGIILAFVAREALESYHELGEG